MNKKILGATIVGLATIGMVAFLTSCKSVKVPEGVEVVRNFKVEKYMGQWYEIARFDFKHEKNLKNVTTNYSLNEDGTVKVHNRGYNFVKNKWEDAKGKAKFIGDSTQAALKVSFFGPFYSGYNVVLMDPDYENVLVFGENTDYIWMLSRNKTMPQQVKDKFVQKATAAGYDMSRLVWTQHD